MPVPGRVALAGPGRRTVLNGAAAVGGLAELEVRQPRWVLWNAVSARDLIGRGFRPSRAWDLAEVHRLLHGGWAATPGRCWAGAQDLPLTEVPTAPRGDLFDSLVDVGLGAGDLLRPDGQLRADFVDGPPDGAPDDLLLRYADAALECAGRQREQLLGRSARAVGTAYAESAAAVVCEELRRDGLPVDRRTLLGLVEPLCGPTGDRDAEVLKLVPGQERTDLRNPAQVRDLLKHAGIDVPNTRKHVLEPFRDVHPVVPALLRWRTQERIATTYGLRWIAEHIGPDDRLRGGWTACDGAAGRMTAEAGLHNLPAMLRPAVAAESGHVLVRADLGQVEPRVLAVVSGDPAFAVAARSEDLYAPVAARLGVDRAVAKVAMLAAMYGQRSGAAGEALRGLERSYPVAMGLLDRAYRAGAAGQLVQTFGGRLVHTGHGPAADPAAEAARGRFARNAIIQGSAAELFKAWVATVRAATTGLGAQLVLCLHDELLVHAPEAVAEEVARAVDAALADASRRWSGGAPVRFVSQTSVVRRWSEAK